MKPIYLLLAPLVVLAACKKDHSSESSTNPANYRLIAYSESRNGTIVDSIELTYTSNTHLLNSYTVVVNTGAVSEITGYQVVYSNNLATRINITSTNYANYYNYRYNANKEIDSITWYIGDVANPVQTWCFKYNVAGQVSDEFVYSQSALQDHNVFRYDAWANISLAFDSSFAGGVSVDTLQYANYDNKVNPLVAIPGYPNTMAPLPATGLQFFSSPNNYGTLAKNAGTAPGQYQTYAYQYNIAGLPTLIVDGNDTVRLTYKQF